MALDKVIDSAWLEAGLKKVCDGIRSKTGGSANLAFPDEMDAQIRAIDTQEDLSPELAEQDGLIAQIQTTLEAKTGGSNKLIRFLITEGHHSEGNVDTVYEPMSCRIVGVYQAEDGMELSEWLESKYNVDSFYFDGQYLRSDVVKARTGLICYALQSSGLVGTLFNGARVTQKGVL